MQYTEYSLSSIDYPDDLTTIISIQNAEWSYFGPLKESNMCLIRSWQTPRERNSEFEQNIQSSSTPDVLNLWCVIHDSWIFKLKEHDHFYDVRIINYKGYIINHFPKNDPKFRKNEF